MRVSFRRCAACIRARDAVIPCFRVHEAPSVAVTTVSLVIYSLVYAYNRRRLGSSHKGPFLSLLGSCDTSQVSATTRQTLRRNPSHRASRRLCERNERTTHEAKEGLGETRLALCALGFLIGPLMACETYVFVVMHAERFSMLLTFAFAAHSLVFKNLSIKPLREIIIETSKEVRHLNTPSLEFNFNF